MRQIEKKKNMKKTHFENWKITFEYYCLIAEQFAHSVHELRRQIKTESSASELTPCHYYRQDFVAIIKDVAEKMANTK